jgi:glycosyltransferase involved in cell wall biosynthesis
MMFNVGERPDDWPRALMLYKTEPFFYPESAVDYRHTNSWEILELSRILDQLGYRVDVVDRSEREWTPADEYALVVGNASGNSGQRYPFYCEATPSAHHVLYATGPNPTLADELVLNRYLALERRQVSAGGYEADFAPMRVMDKIDMAVNLKLSESIVTIDGNGFTRESYEVGGKPIQTFTPSTSPALEFDQSWVNSRDLSSFLCFAGNGFIAKGVDLVVEAFLMLPDYKVTIAGPDTDSDFWRIYGDRIAASPNIDYVGFLDVNGARYAELIRSHSWSLLPSAAEGVCTSVATTMRSGLVPIVTRETAVNTGNFGTLLPSGPTEIIDSLVELIPQLATMELAVYNARVEATVGASLAYTQDAFTESVKSALERLLKE